MFHKRLGIPLARRLFEASLRYLKTHNPHSARALPASARAPAVVLHTGASLGAGGVDHAKLWLPLLEAAGIEYLVAARTLDTYEALVSEHPDRPVALIKDSADTDNLFRRFPSIRAILYVANTANNNQFLRYPQLQHVFLGHGDSDKSASMNRLFKVYDEVYVSGQAHIDRFGHADFDASGIRFRIVGRPQGAALLDDPRAGAAPSRIVYLPTWEGYHGDQAYSSLPFAVPLLSAALASAMPVQAKLHPATGVVHKPYQTAEASIAAALAGSGSAVEFIPRSRRLTEVLAPGAIYVCDVSAAVSECLALDGPIFVHLPPGPGVRIVSGRMGYADYAYTYGSVDEFRQKLQQVLTGDDPLAEARRAAREYFISPHASRSGAFVDAIRSLAGAPHAAAPAVPAAGAPQSHTETEAIL